MSNARTYGTIHSEQKPFVIQHADSTDYLLGGSLVMKNGKIDKVLFEGGYAQASAVSNTTKDKFAFNFYNQDHLGNNREVVDASGNVTQVTNYYPFGAPYADATAVKNANLQQYKYNGKEFDHMHGLNTYDYGARQYNPVTGRWDRIDPLSEKYYSTSPYTYCMNNPVRYVDPDGRDGKVTGQGTKEDPYVITAEYIYKNGELTQKQIDGLNAGLNAYNQMKPVKIKNSDGSASYAKYNLSSKGVDNPSEYRMENTRFENTAGEPRYYGNIVGTQVDNGSEYGSANNIRIDFNIGNINAAVERGANEKSLISGVTIHEVSHNLGADHNDKIGEMSNVKEIPITDKHSSFVYPKQSQNGAMTIMKRRDTPLSDVGRLWTEKKPGN